MPSRLDNLFWVQGFVMRLVVMASSSWMSDFSTLPCEHYVNDFFISVISFKLLEKSKPRSVIYFPSFSQMWAKQGVAYLKHKVTPFFHDCQYILIVHSTGDCFVLTLDLKWSILMTGWRLTLQMVPVCCSKHAGWIQGLVPRCHCRSLELKSSPATNQHTNPVLNWHWGWHAQSGCHSRCQGHYCI